jgi:hypothetical protein
MHILLEERHKAQLLIESPGSLGISVLHETVQIQTVGTEVKLNSIIVHKNLFRGQKIIS